MNLKQLVFGGCVVLGLFSCVEGKYSDESETSPQPTITETPYFSEFPMIHESGMAINSGDFDGDGDLDLIVGANAGSFIDSGKLYFYENDGKGNFTLRPKREYQE